MYNYIGLEPRREALHWQFGEMKFGEMKRNTSNWSNFGMLLRRAGLTASAGLSCLFESRITTSYQISIILLPQTSALERNVLYALYKFTTYYLEQKP